MKTKRTGRITLPKGKTANERAKDAAQPAILRAISMAAQQANLRAGKTGEDMLAGVNFVKQFLKEESVQFVVEAPKQFSRTQIPGAKLRSVGVLYQDDATIEVFDAAVSAAEEKLQTLLPRMKPQDIADRFATHIDTHLATELKGAKKYGNDCEAFRDAVNDGTEPAF